MKQINPVLAMYIVLVFGVNKVIELFTLINTFLYKHEGMLPDKVSGESFVNIFSV